MASGTKVQLRLGERVVAEVGFEGAELRIGRMKENDLVINNLAVSRFHAVLRRVGDAFEIEDLGSENGTLVDGIAVSGAARVPEGADITIGKHTLRLRAGGEGNTRPPLPGKSDVWDAAQTYFVAGSLPTREERPAAVEGADAEPEEWVAIAGEDQAEEAVADAVEAERREEDVAEALEAFEAVDAVEENEPSEGPLAVAAEEMPPLEPSAEPFLAALGITADEEPAAAVDEEPAATVDEEPAATVDEEPAAAADAAPEEVADADSGLFADADPEMVADAAPERVADAASEIVADPAPQALELPDPEDMLGFDEEELVGRAMPDPIAAEAPSAVVEAEEIPTPDPLAGAEAISAPITDVAFESEPQPAAVDAAGQTSLFDFGLTDDLGLSDRSLARAAGSDARERDASGAAPTKGRDAGSRGRDALHAGLIVERVGRVERVVAWDAAELVVGRAPECGLVLTGSGVSRRHAELRCDAGVFSVRDLGSANGVYVNGTRVEHVSLDQGDVVRIDDYTLTFVLDREPVAENVRASTPRGFASSPMLEQDLVLAEDADLEAPEAEKQLETSDASEAASEGVEPGVWAFEVAIATERLPEALRRALDETDATELVLPAQLRLVRRS